MKTNSIIPCTLLVAIGWLIVSSCSHKPYKSQARYWNGHKHTAHYERWR